ncbi:HAD family hydrolase [Bacillus sp. WLY-B-L8]|uniref:HAD family hydrolase n=1 Tax=Bacillus multifaciens TaxID=3068506 RepID=UPI0027426023|nr:HAD family hydrolase [Bacillus sp. WLY-B-L8]MDP7980303.1 HAD family hydrolase [Bacillus sp. WLY-B-L8]
MIFFDIDGTLLDYELAERNGILDFFREYSHIFSGEELEASKLWNQLSEQYFNQFLCNKLSFQEQKRFRMIGLFQKYGVLLTNEEADQKFNLYLSLYKEKWVVYEDVMDVLDTLKQKGYLMGIISNGDYDQQIEKLSRLNILHYFNPIITSSRVGVAKPNIAIFQIASMKAKSPIQDCYYIGDRLETDALSSKNAGMHGIWLDRCNKKQQCSVPTIQSLYELIHILT